VLKIQQGRINCYGQRANDRSWPIGNKNEEKNWRGIYINCWIFERILRYSPFMNINRQVKQKWTKLFFRAIRGNV